MTKIMSICLRQLTSTAIACVVSIQIVTFSCMADDWRGWMGDSRDGVYRETGIVTEIPESGLPVKWRVPIYSGYAGPAAADGRVFVFDYQQTAGDAFNNPGERANLNGSERLVALDATSGKILWTHSYECPYSVSYPNGPRCTPTVDDEHVFILGSEGNLKCLQVVDGKLVWSRSLKRDLKAEVPIWGFSSHPLVDGDLLYTMVGGEGQGVVAFDKRTGDIRWQALDSEAGYCPLSIIQAGQTRQLIAFSPEAVVSLNPKNGRQNWSIPMRPSYGMSIARPMVEGNRMYASSIHNEAVLIELSENEATAKELWRGEPKSAVHCANATPLLMDGIIYGTDCVEGCLIAVDGSSGSRLWKTFEATQPAEKRFIKHGTAFLTRIGDSNRFLVMSETGDLQIAELSEKGYTSRGRFHAIDPTAECFGRSVVWSHPAYANQTAYIRNDKEIIAVDLAR